MLNFERGQISNFKDKTNLKEDSLRFHGLHVDVVTVNLDPVSRQGGSDPHRLRFLEQADHDLNKIFGFIIINFFSYLIVKYKYKKQQQKRFTRWESIQEYIPENSKTLKYFIN